MIDKIILAVAGVLLVIFGINVILEPSFSSIKFGNINFGEYHYLIGIAFVVLGLVLLLPIVLNSRKKRL